jgi:hypothetical protein
MTERQIQKYLLDKLNLKTSGFFWENVTQGYYDKKIGAMRAHVSKHIPKGGSDILGLLNGNFVALEVKTKKEFDWCIKNIPKVKDKKLGELSEKQMHLARQYKFIQHIIDNGGRGGFCCDWDSVIDVIGDLI